MARPRKKPVEETLELQVKETKKKPRTVQLMDVKEKEAIKQRNIVEIKEDSLVIEGTTVSQQSDGTFLVTHLLATYPNVKDLSVVHAFGGTFNRYIFVMVSDDVAMGSVVIPENRLSEADITLFKAWLTCHKVSLIEYKEV